MDYKRYPPYWKQFSEFIRFERAQNKCEQCGVPNYAFRYKSPLLPSGQEVIAHDDDARLHAIESFLCDTDFSVTKVCLTVAHLDAHGDVCQCEAVIGVKCAKPDHVLALCQLHHLLYDIARHTFNRRRNHAKKVGQLWLADIEHRFEQRGK